MFFFLSKKLGSLRTSADSFFNSVRRTPHAQELVDSASARRAADAVDLECSAHGLTKNHVAMTTHRDTGDGLNR